MKGRPFSPKSHEATSHTSMIFVFQKRKLGPGSYNIKDFLQLIDRKPCSFRGICDGLAPRFPRGKSVSLCATSFLLFLVKPVN